MTEPVTRIARHLCAIVETRLWPLAELHGGSSLRGVELRLRVGSGRATYCRAGLDGDFLITFGRGMVASKCATEQAGAWITAREIRKHGYFEGRVTLLNLLAHTALHEFAHLLQIANGWRRTGSVHNRPFYLLLGRLHEADGAGVRDEFERRCIRDRIDLAAMQAWGPGELPHPLPFRSEFRAGMAVEFVGADGRLIRGVVRRVNRRTVSVWPERQSGGAYYRVPHERLRPVPISSAGRE